VFREVSRVGCGGRGGVNHHAEGMGLGRHGPFAALSDWLLRVILRCATGPKKEPQKGACRDNTKQLYFVQSSKIHRLNSRFIGWKSLSTSFGLNAEVVLHRRDMTWRRRSPK
jgi:hypothetical protein